MVFNKKRSDDRKTWLGDYDRNLYLDTNKEEVNCEEFIDKELRPFSKYDCNRSICNIMDGKKSNRIVWSLPIIHSQEGKLVGLIRHHQLINAGLKEVQN